MDAVEHLPAVITVDQRRLRGGARSTVGTITDIAPLLRLLFSRAGEPSVPHADAFSFNLPAGMCPACEGIGEATVVDLDVFLDRSRSLQGGALRCEIFTVGGRNWQIIAGSGRFDVRRPVAEYSDAELHDLLYADGPEAGTEGGRVLYEGTPAGLLHVEGSHTGEYLRRAVAAA